MKCNPNTRIRWEFANIIWIAYDAKTYNLLILIALIQSVLFFKKKRGIFFHIISIILKVHIHKTTKPPPFFQTSVLTEFTLCISVETFFRYPYAAKLKYLSRKLARKNCKKKVKINKTILKYTRSKSISLLRAVWT